MQDHVFRSYDIRGKVGSELLIDQVQDVAHAIALYYQQQDPSIKTVAVGMDGREHSPAIKQELVKGLRASGLDVVFIGVCTTPILYFSQYWLAVDAALMITASHNPPEYNGIKICMRKRSVFGAQIQQILKLFKERKKKSGSIQGSYTERSINREYVSFLKTLFPHLVGLDINAIFDCGHGAAGAVLPELIKQMEWKNAHSLCVEVDSLRTQHEADPTSDENVQDLKAEVLRTNAAVGIGFDGDADRMGAVTDQGLLVPGDRLLTLFSRPVLQALPGAAVAFDIKCSSALKTMVTQWGGNPCMAPSGHSYIKQCMRDNSAVIAGELSCHFFFHDRYFGFDDGIYAALRLLELLVDSKKSLSELLEVVPVSASSPELRIACTYDQGVAVIKRVTEVFAGAQDTEITTIDGVRVDTKDGWGLVRTSNTQPVICLRFESDTHDGLKRVREKFVQALAPCFEKDFIEKQVQWPEL